MRTQVLLLFCILCMLKQCIAEPSDEAENSKTIFNPRKAKHHLLYFLGGLQGLVAFVVLKIKIVLVVITIIGATVMALKFMGLFQYSNYIYKSNYPIIEAPPAFAYGQPFSDDYKPYEYKDEWSGPPYTRANEGTSGNLIDEFLAQAEEFILPLMNFSNEDCRAHTICYLKAIMRASDFRECRKLHTRCGNEGLDNTQKKRVKRRMLR